jgi:hypothetical protein
MENNNNDMIMKKCKYCEIEYEIKFFRPTSLKCKACEKKDKQEYRKKNYEIISKKNKEKYIKNREEIINRNKENYEKNREIYAERFRKYKETHREEINKYRNQYFKDRKAKDPIFKFQQLYRTRLGKALRNYKGKKTKHSYELLGCSIEKLRSWFEFNFDENMNWENQGSYWHIDHIKPCNSYNLENENELNECFNWKNLRPCEGNENIKKMIK